MIHNIVLSTSVLVGTSRGLRTAVADDANRYETYQTRISPVPLWGARKPECFNRKIETFQPFEQIIVKCVCIIDYYYRTNIPKPPNITRVRCTYT